VEDLANLAKISFDENKIEKGERLVKISNDILAHFI
jgi:hypothetical protein